MAKSKQPVSAGQRRTSPRLALKPKAAPAETKKKAAAAAAAKKPPKAKKAKPAENGAKAEEPKAEATEAK